MRPALPRLLTIPSVALFTACVGELTAPSPTVVPPVVSSSIAEPPYNLEVPLRGTGSGYVKFRQPKDLPKIVYLDTHVRSLSPNSRYVLERAVDATVDDVCTSTSWLTLGAGLESVPIATDGAGAGRANLWRDLSAFPHGSRFDIQFRVVDAATGAVVLTSDCYQFAVR
jgi:hypothetical protein